MSAELQEQALQVTWKTTEISAAALKTLIKTLLDNKGRIEHGEQSLKKLNIPEILRQYFINHPQSIDKYTFLQNSAFTHWVKEKCSKMC